ncbi:hypothetical protein [Pantoea sp.]|uniref:hypothetical protein n=1 Tax=Pantoea sp. TaxID=69393 RepID=UPI0028964782|nr:hypothetical protein [Pantoea sp.]
MQIGVELRKANPLTPAEWFFLKYLRKLVAEGTFSQLIRQMYSAKIGDYFLTYGSATLAILLQHKECK